MDLPQKKRSRKSLSGGAEKSRASRTLKDFDLTTDDVATVISDAHDARIHVREFAPGNARGSVFYYNVVAGLRAVLLAKNCGWEAETDHGLEFVTNKQKGLRIGYVAVNAAAGIDDQELRSLRPRGAASMVVAQNNQQLRLPFAPGASAPLADERTDIETWFLAVNYSSRGYRFELALPLELRGDHFADWKRDLPIGELAIESEAKIDAETNSASPKPKAVRKRAKLDTTPAPKARSGNDISKD